jgi:hypothetical protein
MKGLVKYDTREIEELISKWMNYVNMATFTPGYSL